MWFAFFFSIDTCSFNHYPQSILTITFNIIGLKSQPATPIGLPGSNSQMLQALYTDTNGQPIYIMSQQPTLIPLQLQQQPSLQVGQAASQATTTQVHYCFINLFTFMRCSGGEPLS